MRKIEAVKIIRAHAGCGLVEAKHAMDEIVSTGCLSDSTDVAIFEARERDLRNEMDKLRDKISKAETARDQAQDATYRAERRLDVLVDVLAKVSGHDRY